MTKRIGWAGFGVCAWVAVAGCGTTSATRMEPAAQYGASTREYIVPSPTPLNTGPDIVMTHSPDGSTRFVCADGTARNAADVPGGSTPACL